MVRHNVIQRTGGLVLVLSMTTAAAFGQAAPPPKKTTPAKKAAATAPPPLQLQPKALEILKAASDKLSNAKTLSFTAVELFEQLSRQGAPLAYTNKYEVTMQRPDKLRVIRPADAQAADLYVDSTSMMAYVPGQNLLAKTDVPSTIEGALEKAYKTADLYLPFTDFIVTNPYGDMEKGLRHAYYIGQSNVVGGTTTDQVAFAGNGIFAQVWIGAEDKLVRMIRAVYLDDPNHLRHELVFSNWQLDPSIPADTFVLANASTAKLIPFARPTQPTTPSGKPPAKVKPAKAQQ
jgi:hypothetical protein